MDNSLYEKIVRMIPLFGTLAPSEAGEILSISKLLRVKKGVTVVQEGDEGTAMYLLVEGKVSVVKSLQGGDTTQLAELDAPTVFGEMSLIDHAPRSASVITLMESVLFQVDLASFNKLRDSFRPAAFKVLRAIAPTLCQRLRQVNDRIGQFFKNPDVSLADIEQQYMSRAIGSSSGKEGQRGN